MPSFEQGKIWLECEGKRMKEYGERKETDSEGKLVKTCYVEVIPDATFEIHWSYDTQGAGIDGCRGELYVDGRPAGRIAKELEKGKTRVEGASYGYDMRDDAIAPFKFQACKLSDDIPNSDEEDFGSVTCRAVPFVHGPPQTQEYKYAAPSEPEYNTESKAAVIGYAVGQAEEMVLPPLVTYQFKTCSLEDQPWLTATFRYRTWEQLVALGLVRKKPTKAETSDTPTSGSRQALRALRGVQNAGARESDEQVRIKAEAAEELRQARERVRELEDMVAGIGGNDDDVKPKKMRIDASAGGSKNPLKVSVDLTGDDD